LYFTAGESFNTKSERDATAADTRKCVAHLQAIELSIAATLMDNENIDIATAISEIAKKNGYAFSDASPLLMIG